MALVFFSKKLQKNCPGAKGFVPMFSCCWGLCPQTPIWDTFELHNFTRRVSRYRHFAYLTFGLSRLYLAKSWLGVKTRHRLLIFHFSKTLSYKKYFFWKVLMMSLHVICGLPTPSPNQTSWLRLCAYGIRNEKQAQFASKYISRCCLLNCLLLKFIAHWYSFPSKHIILYIQFRSLRTCNISCTCV